MCTFLEPTPFGTTMIHMRYELIHYNFNVIRVNMHIIENRVLMFANSSILLGVISSVCSHLKDWSRFLLQLLCKNFPFSSEVDLYFLRKRDQGDPPHKWSMILTPLLLLLILRYTFKNIVKRQLTFWILMCFLVL
jgi:hypothetical protein